MNGRRPQGGSGREHPRAWLTGLAALLFVAAGASDGRAAALVEEGLMDQAWSAPVFVVVVLSDAGLGGPGESPTWRRSAPGRAAIAQVRSDLVAGLPEGSWRGRHAFTAIPAFTGLARRDALDALAGDWRVQRIGPDARVHGQAAEAVPHTGAVDFHAHTGLEGEGITVGVFDTGIDLDHGDFEGRVIVGGAILNQGSTSDDVQDDHGHGTHVSALLAGSGAVAPVGMAPAAKLLVYKVLDHNTSGWATDWAAAADDAVANHAQWPELRITSSSLVTNSTFSACPCASSSSWAIVLEAAYANLQDAGILAFAASGNKGLVGQLPMPACFDSTVAVGSTHDSALGQWPSAGTYQSEVSTGLAACVDWDAQADTMACFSNAGTCLDMLAPGVAVLTADMEGGATELKTGTSMSTPIAAGAAALLMAYDGSLSPDEVRDALLTSGPGVPLPEPLGGARPRVDVMGALGLLAAVCGDGEVTGVEACDDGGLSDGDCCDSLCEASSEGVSCDDGDACTVGDLCVAGACVGAAILCDDGATCTTDSCDPLSGDCVFDGGGMEGSPCDDGDLCTADAHCEGGACVVTAVVCDDGLACTVDSCDGASGLCVFSSEPTEDLPCDDGDPCTLTDVCVVGACLGTPNACDDGQLCTEDACHADTGLCLHEGAVMDGATCDSDVPCAPQGTCAAGTCAVPADPCDDGDPCTADGCDEASETCVSETGPADGAPCDDGNLCTTDDLCAGGLCAGLPVLCDDGDPCTLGFCEAATGACAHLPMVELGTPCDDGDPCTIADGCDAGQCVGVAVDCDDGLICTTDGCDDATGDCWHDTAPTLGQPCDDGDPCTADDACAAVGCAGSPIACEDHNPCTLASCDSETGLCDFDPAPLDGAACDDGLACTLGEVCQGGLCGGGAAQVCDATAPCMTAACEPSTGDCVEAPAPEGTACGPPGSCDAGVRVSDATCDDDGQCVTPTVTSCAPYTGCDDMGGCATSCEDDDGCTPGHRCQGGECAVRQGAEGCASGPATPTHPCWIGLTLMAAILFRRRPRPRKSAAP